MKLTNKKDVHITDHERIPIYAIHDDEANVFDIPFFARNDLFAKRKFIMDCQKEGTLLNTFKSSFSLHFIGEFNKGTGEIIPYATKLVIITSKEVHDNEISNAT